MSTPRQVLQAVPTAPPVAIVYSPAGRLLATGHEDGTVALWDVERQVLHRLLQLGGKPQTSLAFSPEGSLLATGATAGR